MQGKELQDLARSVDKLKLAARRLQLSANDLKRISQIPALSYNELELIRRVFKSVKPSIRGKEDKELADSILEKTEWIEKGECLDD